MAQATERREGGDEIAEGEKRMLFSFVTEKERDLPMLFTIHPSAESNRRVDGQEKGRGLRQSRRRKKRSQGAKTEHMRIASIKDEGDEDDEEKSSPAKMRNYQ